MTSTEYIIKDKDNSYLLVLKILDIYQSIVSSLPIPPASFSTSWPEHRPRQENNVHHKIKDEQQDTEQIHSVYHWMNTREKEYWLQQVFEPLGTDLD